MSIEITGSELVLINLYDTRCAGRGEVSRVGTSHRDEVKVAFDAHFGYGKWAAFRRSTSPFQVASAVLRRGLFSPGAESCQVVRGHACGHPARNCFGERRPDACVLCSRPHLSLSHGLKVTAYMSARLDDLLVWTSALG